MYNRITIKIFLIFLVFLFAFLVTSEAIEIEPIFIDPIQNAITDEYKKQPLPDQVRYYYYSEMKVGETRIFEVQINRTLLENISDGLRTKGDPQLENIEVDSLIVTLIGDKTDFEITPQTSEKQLLIGEKTTQWKWHVKPLNSGTKKLTFTVNIEIETPDYPLTPYFLTDKNLNILAHPNLIYFLKSNWKWIIATLITIFGITNITPKILKFFRKDGGKKET